MSERWETPEEIVAVRERLEASLPGYVRPAAYAVGLLDPDAPDAPATDVFPLVNVDANYLPAVILADVCGHASGSRTYALTHAQLSTAIDRLAPAEACTAYDHPNLAAWRAMAAESGQQRLKQLVAVFVGDLSDAVTSDADALLRSQLR